MDLAHKVAVVTGASSGIGRVFSEHLVAKGAHVFGLARRAEKLADLKDNLGDAFTPVVCDVTNETDVQDAFATVREQAGRLDILVNNAGLGKFGPLDGYPTDDWNVQVDTNLTGVFFCSRAAVPMMKAQNAETGFGGHIVNIASVAGLVGNANLTAYNATKFGLRGFSEALMKEVREDGIKVTCMYPGSIGTEFFMTAGIRSSTNPMAPEDVSKTLIHVLEGPDNYLISEVMMRPLRPKG